MDDLKNESQLIDENNQLLAEKEKYIQYIRTIDKKIPIQTQFVQEPRTDKTEQWVDQSWSEKKSTRLSAMTVRRKQFVAARRVWQATK